MQSEGRRRPHNADAIAMRASPRVRAAAGRVLKSKASKRTPEYTSIAGAVAALRSRAFCATRGRCAAVMPSAVAARFGDEEQRSTRAPRICARGPFNSGQLNVAGASLRPDSGARLPSEGGSRMSTDRRYWVMTTHAREARAYACRGRVGRVTAACKRRGKSGLHRAGWWVTPTRGNPRESATESRPPRAIEVRVKRWCKRPPAPQVTAVARQTPPGARSSGSGNRSRRKSGPLSFRW
jgi:hypothetical protein